MFFRAMRRPRCFRARCSSSSRARTLTIDTGAMVERIKVGRVGAAALNIPPVTTMLGAQAHYSDFAFTTGSAVTHNQLFVQCAGEGSTVRIAGANLLTDRQHVD